MRHYDQHPVYGDRALRYATATDRERIAALEKEGYGTPVPVTSVSLKLEELEALRAGLYNLSSFDTALLDAKLDRAITRLQERQGDSIV